ncbi:MAG: hypothetical protein KGH91_09365 [Rhodospirillales bacterium]|nr:hypothetical protein [Rhodospirillales bacterium]
MAIWRGQSAVPTVGPEFHVKYKVFGGGTGYNAEAGRAVGLARQILTNTNTLMNAGWGGLSAVQQNYLKYYFRLAAAPNATTLDIIKQTYILVRNGMFSTDLNLKVTISGDANGYVNSHKVSSKKSNHNAGVRGGNAVKRGDIHLDSDRLDGDPEWAAKTTIHEASHKFASTADFGNIGYTDDDTYKFRAAGLTAAQAINNAESYAMFAMMSFMYPTATPAGY